MRKEMIDREDTKKTNEMALVGQKATGRLLFQPWLQNEMDIVGSLHAQAQQMAQVSLLLAAKAGAKLNQMKERCEHGEWQRVVQALPFSSETARRYRALADELQGRLTSAGSPFDLLNLPETSQLAMPEYAEQINQIQQVTGEQTLRQLYFDWGILREPGKKGGDHGGGVARANMSDAEVEARLQMRFRQNWTEMASALNSEGMEDMTWANLERAEIEGLQALCSALAAKMLKHLTATR